MGRPHALPLVISYNPTGSINYRPQQEDFFCAATSPANGKSWATLTLTFLQWTFVQNDVSRDFPGGPVVKNPPYNAGDTGSIPGQGTKIPHAAGQLRPPTTTTELLCLS